MIRKDSDRTSESISVKLLQAVNKIGLFRSMAPVGTELVAKAMIRHTLNGDEGLTVVMPEEIRGME